MSNTEVIIGVPPRSAISRQLSRSYSTLNTHLKKLAIVKKHLPKDPCWLDLRTMKRAFLYIFCTLFVCISASAQEVLYPVRGNTSGLETMHVEVDPNQRDHSRFVA